MTAPSTSEIAVAFSSHVARVVECQTPSGPVSFTVDSGGDGDRSICLEHHPSTMPRSPDYDRAFAAAKVYLEKCGFQVEIHGA